MQWGFAEAMHQQAGSGASSGAERLAGMEFSFPIGFPEMLGWVSEFFARLEFIQTRIWQPADRVLAGE